MQSSGEISFAQRQQLDESNSRKRGRYADSAAPQTSTLSNEDRGPNAKRAKTHAAAEGFIALGNEEDEATGPKTTTGGDPTSANSALSLEQELLTHLSNPYEPSVNYNGSAEGPYGPLDKVETSTNEHVGVFSPSLELRLQSIPAISV